jgi:hypothetical protein
MLVLRTRVRKVRMLCLRVLFLVKKIISFMDWMVIGRFKYYEFSSSSLAMNSNNYLFNVETANGCQFSLDGRSVTVDENRAYVQLRGWCVAAIPRNQRYLLLVLIGNKAYYASRYNMRRDVAKAYNEKKYLFSGFTCWVPANDIGPGRHDIELLAIERRQRSCRLINTDKHLIGSITKALSYPGNAYPRTYVPWRVQEILNVVFKTKRNQKEIDVLSRISKDDATHLNTYIFVDTVNGEYSEKLFYIDGAAKELLIEGWAYDTGNNCPYGSIYALVDGKAYKAQSGKKRTDLVKNGVNLVSDKVGYSCRVKVKKSDDGKHVFKIVLVDIYGANYYVYNISEKFRFIDGKEEGVRLIEGLENCPKRFRIMKVREFCKKNNIKYSCEKTAKRDSFIYPPYYYKMNYHNKAIRVSNPELYIACIRNAIVNSRSSSVITDNDRCLFDLALSWKAFRYNFGDGIIISKKGRSFFLKTQKMAPEAIQKGIHLCGTASANYYHFLFDFIAKLRLINGKDEFKDYPLLINVESIKYPQMREALNWYSEDRKYLPLACNNSYKVIDLVLPSSLTWAPLNIKDRFAMKSTDVIISKEAVEFLRNHGPVRGSGDRANRKIYLSRKSKMTAGYRKLQNEEDVEKLFLKYGFELVFPERLSFFEQVEIFSESRVIAGPTGSAFANIVYAPCSAIIICLMNCIVDYPIWSTIAGFIGQKMVHVAGDPMDARELYKYQSDYTINLDTLRTLLEETC